MLKRGCSTMLMWRITFRSRALARSVYSVLSSNHNYSQGLIPHSPLRQLTTKSPPGDLVLEGLSCSTSDVEDTEHLEEVKSDNNMRIEFTCNKCNARTTKNFSRLAYTKGLVIIRCPSCQSLHLIADNIGWIREQTPWRIGEQKHLLKPSNDKDSSEKISLTPKK